MEVDRTGNRKGAGRLPRTILRKTSASLKPAALPTGPFQEAGGVIIAVEGASSFRELIRSGRVRELADPLGQINGYVNEQISGADYQHALRVREILQEKMMSTVRFV